MSLEDPESDIAQIMEQVKPVSDLNRVGCSLSSTLRIFTAAVATDHFDTGVCGKPRREGLCAPIGEQINCAMPLQIDEDTAVGATTPKGEIIHAHDSQRWWGSNSVGADARQQSIAADAHTEMMQESRSRFTSEGKRDLGEPVIEFAGAAREGSNESRETFGKSTTRAARIATEEPADMELQSDVQAIDGHVTGMSPVRAMDSP